MEESTEQKYTIIFMHVIFNKKRPRPFKAYWGPNCGWGFAIDFLKNTPVYTVA